MIQSKRLVIVLVALIVGFGAGFTLRPVFLPGAQTVAAVIPAVAVPAMAEPRATQYFAAHLDEARQIVARCGDGSVRGSECANAQAAVTEADGRARFKKFMGN